MIRVRKKCPRCKKHCSGSALGYEGISSQEILKVLLLPLLHLSHSADEAECIIYILQLFHETSCSIKKPVDTMQLVVHNAFRFTDSLIIFFVSAIQKNRTIQVASHVLALRYRGHANDVKGIVKILCTAKS